MADSKSLIITADDALTGRTQQLTITDINPNAQDQHLLTFAQMTNALSKDTYKEATLIIRHELEKTNPRVFTTKYGLSGNANIGFEGNTINLTTSQCATARVGYYYRFFLGFFPFTEGYLPFVECDSSAGIQVTCSTISYPSSRWANGGISIQVVTEDYESEQTIQPQSINVKVTFPAWGNYDEWSKTYVFNITEG